ncbi:MAG: NADH-quinone oxidoreductase subunit J [Chloroflexaceae bacterium]|nr:NADH-quinone oxidoreductase subunit J [Chloroflexaceae bacterium]
MQLLVQVIFVLIAAEIVGAAVMVVTAKNIVHAALWLIASFCGVGALYLLLEAEFLAVVQVLVYVGAISILMLFAIMLTRHVTGKGAETSLYQRWWVGLIVAAVLFAAVIAPTVLAHPWETATAAPALPGETGQPAAMAGIVDLGRAFVEEYLLPFEIAAVLLLVGLVGAIVIAFEERAARRHIPTLAEEVAHRRQPE